MKQPDREWIQQQLSRLTAHSEDLRDVGGTTDDPEFGAWTALKLVLLTATVNVYSSIMENNNFDFYYVDAMSGSGIVELDGRDECITGSPFIAGTLAHEPFSKLYFIEDDSSRAQVLRERLDYAAEEIEAFRHSRDDCIVIDGDANTMLPTIPDKVREEREGHLGGENGQNGAHHLAFIDNERDEVKFEALRKLESEMWGDLLINYQEVSLNREWGDIQDGRSSEDEFVEFFDGDCSVKRCESPEDRFDLYQSKIESINRPVIRSVDIRASDRYPYGYKMVYATRKTGSGSEYADFVEAQRRKIESLTGEDIETVLDTMQGGATHLGLWSTAEDEEGQARMGEF